MYGSVIDDIFLVNLCDIVLAVAREGQPVFFLRVNPFLRGFIIAVTEATHAQVFQYRVVIEVFVVSIGRVVDSPFGRGVVPLGIVRVFRKVDAARYGIGFLLAEQIALSVVAESDVADFCPGGTVVLGGIVYTCLVAPYTARCGLDYACR